jgi:hypothetical protein
MTQSFQRQGRQSAKEQKSVNAKAAKDTRIKPET